MGECSKGFRFIECVFSIHSGSFLIIVNMKIFRLETSNGDGPWRGGDIDTVYAGFCYDCKLTHPSPEDDGLAFAPIKRWIFGCDSMEQLRFWFCAGDVNEHTQKYSEAQAFRYEDKDYAQFSEYGYAVSVYDVPDDECAYGDSLRQLAFNPFKAELIKTVPLTVLFDGV